MKKALDLGSKIWTEYAVSINVETPIIGLSKGGDSGPRSGTRSPAGIYLELLRGRTDSLPYVRQLHSARTGIL